MKGPRGPGLLGGSKREEVEDDGDTANSLVYGEEDLEESNVLETPEFRLPADVADLGDTVVEWGNLSRWLCVAMDLKFEYVPVGTCCSNVGAELISCGGNCCGGDGGNWEHVVISWRC